MPAGRSGGYELLAGVVVLTAYAATLARTVTRWDSGEFLAAVHSLGIPHPPGTPLYVLAARLWAMLTWPLPFAVRVNLFSAVCAAAAVTLLGILVRRWTREPLAGVAATLCAGGMSSLWLSAAEAEVYTPALLFAVVLLWAADAARAGDPRRLALLAFLSGLGWTLHPAALVTLPAAAVLLLDPGPLRLEIERGAGDRRPEGVRTAAGGPSGDLRPLLLVIGAGVLGLSAVAYLLVRAQQDPAINQGNPATLRALWDVLTRAQYESAGFWPRQAPLWLQLANWLEYADWQVALGMGPEAPPSWRRTPITLLFGMLGIAGFLAHRSADRRSWRAMVVAFAAATVGVVLYLNLKAGPSFGYGVLPADAVREARERDYFFLTSFVIWGAWAGVGALWLARATVLRRLRLPIIGAVLLAVLPLLLNFREVYRQRAVASVAARETARGLLTAPPPRAVLLAVGDNDTYPLWYLQEVEGYRRDVTIVTIPLLGTAWYRDELARRHRLLGRPFDGRGTSDWVGEVCMHAAAQSRPVVLTPGWRVPNVEDRCSF